jgi:hypothetical protein
LQQAPRLAAVGVDGVELRAAVAAQRDGQVRPSGDQAGRCWSPEVGDQARAAGHVVHIDHRLARLEGHIGQLPPEGDQAGEMIGSGLASADCAFSPSASATHRL